MYPPKLSRERRTAAAKRLGWISLLAYYKDQHQRRKNVLYKLQEFGAPQEQIDRQRRMVRESLMNIADEEFALLQERKTNAALPKQGPGNVQE